MTVARVVDDALVALQREGALAHHPSVAGEEAVVVGAAAAMDTEDWLLPASRDFAAVLWRGMPLDAYVHHVFGCARDAVKARDPASPPFWRPGRVPSVSPLVGTQISHAAGVALAAKTRREPAVVLVFFGDGATSGNDFHAGLNFAGVYRLPLVAVCRNNGWATSMPTTRSRTARRTPIQTASPGLAIKALAYGIASVAVDGSDAVAVWTAVRRARVRAAAGDGATLVEALVAGADGESGVQRVDPIERMRRRLEEAGAWDAGRDARLRQATRAEIERSVALARAAGRPERNTLFDDVYAAPPPHLEAQRDADARRGART